jgi:hypothetical protein
MNILCININAGCIICHSTVTRESKNLCNRLIIFYFLNDGTVSFL